MKYVEVNGTDLEIGDVVWDTNPNKVEDATKFKVVSFDYVRDDLLMEIIGESGEWYYYISESEEPVLFPLTSSTWYREEGKL